MTRLRQIVFFLAAATAALTAHAQNPPAVPARKISTNSLPPLPLPVPQAVSPVKFFRDLLAMSPKERSLSLTNRTPEARERIMTKVREYLALNPDERELRLRATELRWYLAPLFRTAPAGRAERVAAVPEDLRELVKSRLAQWDLLPPGLQKEFLDSDHALHYFAHVEATNAAAASPESQKISAQFNQFFELTAEEKQQTLQTLSNDERAAMEKTLQSFEKLPAQQRLQCVRNYAKFAGMNGTERAEFLKSAERWSQMSPQERQSWRDLVAHVPEWPPLPPAIVPQNLIPHAAPRLPRASMATN
jgi:hypothetical protein